MSSRYRSKREDSTPPCVTPCLAFLNFNFVFLENQRTFVVIGDIWLTDLWSGIDGKLGPPLSFLDNRNGHFAVWKIKITSCHQNKPTNILIEEMQETKVTSLTNINTLYQSIIRRDQDRGGISEAIYFTIHKSIQYSSVTLSDLIPFSRQLNNKRYAHLASNTNIRPFPHLFVHELVVYSNIEHLLEVNYGINMGDLNGHPWHSDFRTDIKNYLSKYELWSSFHKNRWDKRCWCNG